MGWCGLYPVVTMAGPYFLRVYVRLRDADGGLRAPLSRRHGACHSDNITQGRAESDAARHRLLRGLPWSPETSGGPGQRRHWPGYSEQQLPSSSVQPWPSLSTERAWQSHLGCGQWTAGSGSSVVMISITRE